MNDLSFQDIDSRATVLFESDELAPHEHQLTFRRRTPLEPEKRLMLAVLEDAISCLQRYYHSKSVKEAKLHAEAVAWIFEQSENRVFSFENICDTCGLDPGYLRMGLSHWREQMTAIKSSRGRTLRRAWKTSGVMDSLESRTNKPRASGLPLLRRA